MKKKVTEAEWKEIGNQSKLVRDELHKLINLSYGRMPKYIVRFLNTSLRHLNRYRSEAEEEMLRNNKPKEDKSDLRVFYG